MVHAYCTGQVAKICNNLILGISMAAVSEAMNLGVKMGIDPKTLADIVNTCVFNICVVLWISGML